MSPVQSQGLELRHTQSLFPGECMPRTILARAAAFQSRRVENRKCFNVVTRSSRRPFHIKERRPPAYGVSMFAPYTTLVWHAESVRTRSSEFSRGLPGFDIVLIKSFRCLFQADFWWQSQEKYLEELAGVYLSRTRFVFLSTRTSFAATSVSFLARANSGASTS